MTPSLPRLLLVEDDRHFAKLVGWAVREYTVEHVSTLREGLEALRTAPPGHYAGIVLDLNLPDSSKLTTLYTMLQHCRALPIVALTGEPGLDCRGPGYVVRDKAALDLGALGYELTGLLFPGGPPP